MFGGKGGSDERSWRSRSLDAASPGAVAPVGMIEFEVRSFTRPNVSYKIRFENGNWKCNCPAWLDREGICKHIKKAAADLNPFRPPATDVATQQELRPTYGQDWPAYDAARQAMPLMFDQLLWDLLEGVPESLQPVGREGRKPLPLRLQLLMAVKKVYLTTDSRTARGRMILESGGKGMIKQVPNYATPSRLFNREETAGILLDLVERSALPLRDLEDGGTFAIDSSGFTPTCSSAYCTEKHDPTRRHQFIKAHTLIGCKTGIVVSVKITDDHGADCPQFIPLLRLAVSHGFRPAKITGDKAYLSRANLTESERLGIDPFIPMKSNSIRASKGCRMWIKKFHEFHAMREEFDASYHMRSNVEAVFSSIKRRLGERLLSKNGLSRLNELLAKILVHNICVIIHEIYEHGIDPGVPGAPASVRKLPPPEGPNAAADGATAPGIKLPAVGAN
ncbi:MAG: transposase [Thermoplasmata archaeon]|nr:transposase [Thermoplasmata archaeon]MCI4359783.1 transposase [Thermoplasmata archaeon]